MIDFNEKPGVYLVAGPPRSGKTDFVLKRIPLDRNCVIASLSEIPARFRSQYADEFSRRYFHDPASSVTRIHGDRGARIVDFDGLERILKKKSTFNILFLTDLAATYDDEQSLDAHLAWLKELAHARSASVITELSVCSEEELEIVRSTLNKLTSECLNTTISAVKPKIVSIFTTKIDWMREHRSWQR